MVKAPIRESFDPLQFVAKVGTGKKISNYRKDEVIFSQGEVADTVFYIQKGRVKVVVLSEQGKEAVVGIMEAGQVFGEGCLNGHDLRIANDDGDRRKSDYRDRETLDVRGLARRAEVFGIIRGLPFDQE